MTCSTHYREFTAKLNICSDLNLSDVYNIQCIKDNINRNNTRNHNTRFNVVHPQCRGYVHKLRSIQLATKLQFDLRTQLQIPSVLKIRAHSSRPLRTQLQVFPQSFLQKPSAHPAAEVVHAHSWDLTFPYKINLSFALFFLTS